MADGVNISEATAGSLRKVSTDQRTIGGDTQEVQRVNDIGGSALASGRANVTTTAGAAIAARDTRKRVVLLALPTNTDIIDVGDSGVSSGSGFPLYPGASLTLHTTAAIYADAASGTQVLAYVEEYDSP